MNNIVSVIKRRYNSHVSLVLESLLIGTITGFIIVIYRKALTFGSGILEQILFFIKGKPLFIVGWFLVLFLIAYIIDLMLKKEPLISGSGIPQIEGELSGHINSKWYKIILYKFIGGFLSLFAGLSLGREGPSIQLGAMVGKGVAVTRHRDKTEQKYLMTCGASAGLAAAFHAPLAGVMFAIEEVHKKFSPQLIVCVMTSTIASDYFIANVLGMKPIFNFDFPEKLNLAHYPIVIFIGLACGLFGVLYNNSLMKLQKYMTSGKITHFQRVLIPFVLAGVIGIAYPMLLGPGESLIGQLQIKSFTTLSLIVLLFLKFLFSIISYSSGAPGGIFFPILVLGSIIGYITFQLAGIFIPFDEGLLSLFIILGMVGLFSSIVRAPVTGIILVFEMTGELSSLLSLSIVAIISYLVAEGMKCNPIYDSLAKSMIERYDNLDEVTLRTNEKMVLEFSVYYGSAIENKLVKDVVWPKETLLITVVCEGEERIPNGDTFISSNSVLLVVCDIDKQSFVEGEMEKLTKP